MIHIFTAAGITTFAQLAGSICWWCSRGFYTPWARDIVPLRGCCAKISTTDHYHFEQLPLKAILKEAGFRLGNPSTWAEQAQLAAAGEWIALEKLQDELQGGKRG